VKRSIRFQLDGMTYQVEVEREGDQLTVSREGEQFTVSLLDAFPAPAQPAAPAAPGGHPSPPRGTAREPRPPEGAKPGEAGAKPAAGGLLCAPMTGLVKEVKVAAGSRVARGEVVLVMEAMKMDVEVSAPAAGVVAEVNVSAGQTVESQAPLLRIRD
jgi:biotin carboxyl carrier protein